MAIKKERTSYMKREAKALLNKINKTRDEAMALVKDGDIEAATEKKAELEKLQAQFDLMNELDAEDEKEIEAGAGKEVDPVPTNEPKSFKKTEVVSAFVHSFCSRLTKGKISLTARDEEVMKMMNEMKEGVGADGGLIVPQDIQTDIKELRRTSDDLEMLVNVETVSTKTGSRVIEKEADTTPFAAVDESGEFIEQATPQFVDVKYDIKKYGGILKVTFELLKDTAQNVMNYLNNYIAKKSRATRNFHILSTLAEMTKDSIVAVTNLDGFKDVFNETLDPAIAATSVIVTNQSGFNYLDKLKDSDGNYILQKDPTSPTTKLLFGTYKIVPVSNKVLAMNGTKAPFYCGDLKEAITLFDREKITIDINENVYWVNDKTGIKIRDRFDIKAIDAEAVVKVEIDTAASIAPVALKAATK